MTAGFKHVELGMLQRHPVRFRALAGQMQRERLTRDRMAVLQAGVADRVGCRTCEFRKLARYPIGIRAAFLYAHEYMLARAVGTEAEVFVDEEILRRRAQHATQRRAAVRIR